MRFTLTLRLLLVPVALGLNGPAQACTIPVFRYALERWELSPYDAVVFHRGDLPAETRSFLDSLTRDANLIVTAVDLDGKLTANQQKLWDSHGKPAELPGVIVRRPDADAKAAPIWSGRFERESLRQLIDSPARQKMVTALTSGSSGVFLLLLSGDRAADNAAQELLDRQLAIHAKRVKLPEQRGDGPRIRLALPLKVEFSVLPVRRDDPAEALFVDVLLGSEDTLGKVAGPIVFPIIGRGRLLCSMSGKELNAEDLFGVVSFMCGECSCQVKEQNPGMDLPIRADWPAIFERIGPAGDSRLEVPPATAPPAAEKPPATPVTTKPAAADGVRVAVSHYPESPEPVFASDAGPASTAVDPPHRRWLWLTTMAASVLVLLTGAWAHRQWRRRPQPTDVA
jgi:hypothetical protein